MLRMFWFRLIAWPLATLAWCLVLLAWHSLLFGGPDDAAPLRSFGWIAAIAVSVGALCISYGIALQEKASAKDVGTNVVGTRRTG